MHVSIVQCISDSFSKIHAKTHIYSFSVVAKHSSLSPEKPSELETKLLNRRSWESAQTQQQLQDPHHSHDVEAQKQGDSKDWPVNQAAGKGSAPWQTSVPFEKTEASLFEQSESQTQTYMY